MSIPEQRPMTREKPVTLKTDSPSTTDASWNLPRCPTNIVVMMLLAYHRAFSKLIGRLRYNRLQSPSHMPCSEGGHGINAIAIWQ